MTPRPRPANSSFMSSAPSLTSSVASSLNALVTVSPQPESAVVNPVARLSTPDTISAARKLVQSGFSPTQAAQQLGIGRATAYRITKQHR